MHEGSAVGRFDASCRRYRLCGAQLKTPKYTVAMRATQKYFHATLYNHLIGLSFLFNILYLHSYRKLQPTGQWIIDYNAA